MLFFQQVCTIYYNCGQNICSHSYLALTYKNLLNCYTSCMCMCVNCLASTFVKVDVHLVVCVFIVTSIRHYQRLLWVIYHLCLLSVFDIGGQINYTHCQYLIWVDKSFILIVLSNITNLFQLVDPRHCNLLMIIIFKK